MAETPNTTTAELSAQRHITQHGEIFEVPDFTIKEVYDAIPLHCFKPSLTRSMLYVARDFGYVSILYMLLPSFNVSQWHMREPSYGLYTLFFREWFSQESGFSHTNVAMAHSRSIRN